MSDERPRIDPTQLAPVLAPGAEFSGLLVLHGATRIDGSIRGEIVGADVLCIGPGACVEASLAAQEIVVAGEVRGDLVAGRRVELRRGARVVGNVETPVLSVAEGSFLEGRCRSGPVAQPPSEVPRSS
jgi:cytoskeletal protein CcmA (bactofilin family)